MREIETLGPETPIALFDIDGTLTTGYTIYSFAEYLVGNNAFDPIAWEAMRADFETYGKSKKTNKDYEVFAVNLVDHYAQGLKGRSESDTIERAGEFFEGAINGRIADYQILGFASELVGTMNKHGTTIAVSGSPKESLDPLIHHLGIEELWATELGVMDGIFTGNVIVNMALDKSKGDVVEQLKRVGYDKTRSFAFGDSPHDSPLLEVVDEHNAFIVGTNEDLFERGKGTWTVLSTSEEVMPAVRTRVIEVFGGDA